MLKKINLVLAEFMVMVFAVAVISALMFVSVMLLSSFGDHVRELIK